MQGKVFRNAGITVSQCRVKCFAMQGNVFLSERGDNLHHCFACCVGFFESVSLAIDTDDGLSV